MLSPTCCRIVCLHMHDLGDADNGEEADNGVGDGEECKITSSDEVLAWDYV